MGEVFEDDTEEIIDGIRWRSGKSIGFSRYKISENSEIKCLVTNVIRNLYPSKRSGYVITPLKNDNNVFKNVVAHQLSAQLFIKKPEGTINVDHVDRNRSNNHISNLRWSNPKQQCANRKTSPENPGKCREVLQYKLTGEFIKEFPSVKQAIKENPTCKRIAECCRGVLKTNGGFLWKYKENVVLIPDEVWKISMFPGCIVVYASSEGRVKWNNKIIKGAKSQGYISMAIPYEELMHLF